MKSKIGGLLLLSLSQLTIAQIKTNLDVSQRGINNQTAFFDASSSVLWNGTNNQGKGLVFPRTDLTVMTSLIATPNGIGTSYPTRLDGMIVYNTGTGPAKTGTGGVVVTPGFYYYENKSNTLNGGTWKPLGKAPSPDELFWERDNGKSLVRLKSSTAGSTPRTSNNLFIKDDGKVGVNAETPSATLNVKSLVSAGKNLELENHQNTKLVSVLNNGKIGVNYHTPEYVLDIKGIGQSYNDNSIALRTFRESTLSGGLDFFKARGTAANPTAIQKGDVLGSVGFVGYNGTRYANSFRIAATVTGDVSTDPAPTYYESSLSFLKETAAATQTPLMTIHHTGNVGIGTSNPASALHIIPASGTSALKLERLETATGTEDVLVAGADGVVKKVSRASLGGNGSGAVKVGNTAGVQCTLQTIGTINFGEVTVENEPQQAFGFCTKNTNGKPMWMYMVAGNNIFSSINPTFGQGL